MRFRTSGIAALALFLTSVSVKAELRVKFECKVQDSPNFSCNQLRTRFFAEKSIPFVAEGQGEITITVSRTNILNGSSYATTVSKKNPDGTEISRSTKADVLDSVAMGTVLQKLNANIQKDVLSFASLDGEVDVKDGNVVARYKDPTGNQTTTPSGPKTDTRWVITPVGKFTFNNSNVAPYTLNFSGGSGFNFSGERARIGSYAYFNYNRSTTTVPVDDQPILVAVNTFSGTTGTHFVYGLDKQNKLNFGAAGSIFTQPVVNINSAVNAAAGIEYNPRPFLTADSMTMAFGCNLGATLYHFDKPNLLEDKRFVGAYNNCIGAVSKLLEEERGSKITGSLNANWLFNQPEFLSVKGNIVVVWRFNKYVSLDGSLNLSYQTKAINTASPNISRSTAGLSPEQIAEENVKFAAQTTSAANLSYGVAGGFTFYINPEGGQKDLNDQRGLALPK